MSQENKKDSALQTRKLVATGLLICLGLLLPYFTGHAAGIPGTVLLPMHIPVLLCGLLCGPRYGAMCGIVLPILSSALTGMPVPYPMLPIMAGELFTYGTLGGLLYRRLKLPIYAALPLAMLAGRCVYGLIFALLTLVGDAPLKALSVWAAITTGLPGIVIQLLLVPPLVKVLERTAMRPKSTPNQNENPDPLPTGAGHTQDLDPQDEAHLADMAGPIREGEYTCMVMQNGQVVYRASGPGVKPLLGLYDAEKEKFEGSLVADRIVGKAAAMIMVLGGAKAVYGQVMSQHAALYLKKRAIPHAWGELAPRIENRTGDGMCPIESAVLHTEDPQEGLASIRARIAELMTKKA